ncbi:hypothetical protein CBR_g36463 [Chara braunii]|uniref:Uncharacterized protein n=1 Tax=Chara braunii TaxID=69332 RepID=A0A388LKS4_CHABU|nr:hypothetical protein CBR_g36463 [Chara braunii]|eukprot:GBG82936.1 hypothetical protein CBR_g36463 [Chara braunii]
MPPTGYYPPAYGWQPLTWGYGQKQPSVNPFPGPGQWAWFTKEHLDLIEKWKARNATEESKRSGHAESSGGSNSTKNRKTKGKEDDDSEARIKSWISSTFGNSLKKIAEKLDDVDKRMVAAMAERGGDEEEMRRRRDVTRSIENGVKMCPLRINILDEEGDGKVLSRSNRDNAIGEDGSGNAGGDAVKLNEIKGILVELMGKMGKNANSGGRTTELKEREVVRKGKGKLMEVESEEVSEEESDHTKKDSDQAYVMEYMRCRLDYYMTLKYKELRALCKKRELKCERKDKGAWELAKQDTEVFSKLVNTIGDEERERTDDEEEENDEEEDSEEKAEDDVAGN